MTTMSNATDEGGSGRGTSVESGVESGVDARVDSSAVPRAASMPAATEADRAPRSGDAAAGAMSFEESTRRLAKIVAELEGGDLPLERALSLFEEGIRLSRSAQERLDRAEKRVEELLGMDADGRPVTREFES
ncbi:exodeoxyribonuclease VII small subunit [Sorangium sp. So ce1000]|uniref:exodeoxyribonuclease VII small subunit n=1 Tax=Sorangium sp. So ce1000 TaxID=3133325 RepID=UPI003F62817C